LNATLGLNRPNALRAPEFAEGSNTPCDESKGNAFVMAGGSDLLVRMKGEHIEPNLIVDIKAITGLGEIKQTSDGFMIGAAFPAR